MPQPPCLDIVILANTLKKPSRKPTTDAEYESEFRSRELKAAQTEKKSPEQRIPPIVDASRNASGSDENGSTANENAPAATENAPAANAPLPDITTLVENPEKLSRVVIKQAPEGLGEQFIQDGRGMYEPSRLRYLQAETEESRSNRTAPYSEAEYFWNRKVYPDVYKKHKAILDDHFAAEEEQKKAVEMLKVMYHVQSSFEN